MPLLFINDNWNFLSLFVFLFLILGLLLSIRMVSNNLMDLKDTNSRQMKSIIKLSRALKKTKKKLKKASGTRCVSECYTHHLSTSDFCQSDNSPSSGYNSDSSNRSVEVNSEIGCSNIPSDIPAYRTSKETGGIYPEFETSRSPSILSKV